MQKSCTDMHTSTDVNYLLNAASAIRHLGISRHNFDKAIERGLISKSTENNSTGFRLSDLHSFMATNEYKEMVDGVVDSRNSLNDLTGKEWIPETKSYLYQKGLGASHPHAQIERQHPAPYSFQDIEKLIAFFTKKGMIVLDPFGGVGSTAKAADILGRLCISIELSPKYHSLSIERLESEIGVDSSKRHRFINGDSCAVLPTLADESVDFVVTSPPYWGILNKQDQKVIKNRVNYNLDTKYSDSTLDLGNISDYSEFLDILTSRIFAQCARVLKKGRYMAIVVSDFRDKGEFISFHSDLISRLNHLPIGRTKLYLQGTKILIQNHKSLHPYGYPFSYVENIHHQYILIFRRK
ncbi:MAG: site-specific DNA-methyltransferase [Bacteroidales bacterium]|nr:site-specific DNA-methyltransferase [Bacteroidales bacterium]